MDYQLTLNETQANLLHLDAGDLITVSVEARYEDVGIGPYEYWGATGVDSHWEWTIESVKFQGTEIQTTRAQDDAIVQCLEKYWYDPN